MTCTIYTNVLPHDLWKRLSSLEHQPNTEEYSYWLPIKDGKLPAPRSIVEQAINYIYENRMPCSTQDFVGVEWWIHNRDPTTYMSMHFDKDEGFFVRNQVLRHPKLSSVYYVNDKGGPTLVVDQWCTHDNKKLIPKEPLRGIATNPRNNQILFFPGDRLHGVLPAEPQFKRVGGAFVRDLAHESVIGGRITLLMNWWIHPLEDPSCVSLEYSSSNYARYGYGSVSFVQSESTVANQQLLRQPDRVYGTEVTDIYFYDHDGSKQRAWEQSQLESKESESRNHSTQQDIIDGQTTPSSLTEA